jgi:hypothetical protein
MARTYKERKADAAAIVGERVKPGADPLATFFANVAPAKSIAPFRDDVLQAATRGYSAMQICGYLKAAHGLDVSDRTLRKFVNEEYLLAVSGQVVEGTTFNGKARMALGHRPGGEPARAKPLRPAPGSATAAAGSSPASVAGKSGALPDLKSIKAASEASQPEESAADALSIFNRKKT